MIYEELKRNLLADPETRREYEAQKSEFALVRAFLAARRESGLTQKELSALSGVTQSDISKLERGNGNPSFKTLKKLASAMGMEVQIQFVPLHESRS